MKMKAFMRDLPLFVVYISTPLIYRQLWVLSAVMVLISFGFYILYKLIEDEILIYIYSFPAILAVIFSLAYMNPYSLETIAQAYFYLTLIILHITLVRFHKRFGMVHRDTIMHTLTAILLGAFSTTILMSYPAIYGFWGVLAALAATVGIIIYILFESKERGNTS